MTTKANPRFFAPFEVKARDDEARTFEGLAAAFSLDLDGDVIHPGAFKRTLDHWKTSGRVLPLMDMHSPKLNPTHSVTQHTLGKLIDAEEKAEGLWAKFQIAKTRAGDDLLALLRDGMVEGLSIGYKAINPQRDEKGIRHLRELKLAEISIVTYGANPEAVADLSSVKALTAALRDGTLTPEQEAEIRGLPEEQKQYFRALLDAKASGPAHDEEPDEFDLRAQEMLDRLRLGRLATA